MAIQTKQIVAFDQGACVWEYDYDDVGMFLTALRCNNTAGQYPTRGTVTVVSNGRTRTGRVVAGNTFDTGPLPTGAQARLGISIDSRGRVDGIDWHFEYGAGV